MSQIAKIQSSSSAGNMNVTFVNSTPFQAVNGQELLVVNTSTVKTILLPSNPPTGSVFIIKDGSGDAGSNVATVDGNGKTIDSMTQYFVQTNYGFVQLVFNGIEWNVIAQ